MTRSRLLAALAVLALAAPVAASAATPLGGVTYRDCTVKHGTTVCKVNQLSVAANGRKVTNFVAFTRCAPVPFKAPLAMKINGAGIFSLAAKRTAVNGQTVSVTISGKFTAPDRARGTMRFRRGGCDTGRIRFDVKPALG